MENIDLLKISDISLAAALLCRGFGVSGIDPSNPKRVFFYFIDSEEVRGSVADYWNGALLVDPKEHANYRRELLDRIHQGIE